MREPDTWYVTLDSWVDGFYRQQFQYSQRLIYCTWVIIAFMALMLLMVGPLAQSKYAWDITLLFDGGYRILNGLVPHLDYSSPIGYLPQGLMAWMMSLSDGSSYALVMMQVVWLSVLLSLTGWIASKRLSPFALCCMLSMITLLTLSACYPDKSPLSITYAGIYNRMGWGLFLVLMCYLLVDPIKALSRTGRFVEALLMGVLVSAVLLTKVNFAVAVGFMLLMALLTGRLSKDQLLGMIIGGLTGLLYVMVIHDYDPMAHIKDTLGLLAVEREDGLLSNLSRRIERNLFSITLALFVVVLWYQRINDRTLKGHFIFLIPGVWGAGLIAASGNSDGYYLPFLGLSLLCWLSQYRDRSAVLATRLGNIHLSAWLSVIGSGVAAKLILPLFISTNMAFINTGWRVPVDQYSIGLPLPDTKRSPELKITHSNQQYRDYLSQGSSILAPRLNQYTQSVFVLDWINPFNWLHELPPASNDVLFWHVGHVVDGNNMPESSRLLDGVDLIMIPKYPLQDEAKEFIYTNIKSQLNLFLIVAENDYWWLYERSVDRRLGQDF